MKKMKDVNKVLEDVNKVLEDANKKFDTIYQDSAFINDKSARTQFVLGWLQSQYEQLYNESNE